MLLDIELALRFTPRESHEQVYIQSAYASMGGCRAWVEENIGSTLTFCVPAVPGITQSGTEYL
jgi:hypothetical protein